MNDDSICTKVEELLGMKDYIEKPLKDINVKVIKTLKNVSDIDDKIVSLIEQRNYLLYGLNDRTTATDISKLCLFYNTKKIMREYLKDGFRSDLVKEVVKRIRCLFFDDTDEKMRKFCCVQITNGSSYDDDIKFIFSDSDDYVYSGTNQHVISLSFNNGRDEYKHLYEHKLLTGYIYFGVNIGYDIYTVMRSFDIGEIRKSIKDYVDNGFTAKKFEFEHSTLIERISDVFTDFNSLEYDKRSHFARNYFDSYNADGNDEDY